MEVQRTPPKKKAQQMAKYLRTERPDYNYLKKLFYHLRNELEVKVPTKPKKLPTVPSAEEIQRLYEVVWKSKRFGDMVIIKTFLYTGVRVSELVNIRLEDVDFSVCQIRINKGKGNKDRIVPFPPSFKETLAMHHQSMLKRKAVYLFESSWNRKYSERGIRKMLRRYADAAGISTPISPHKLRHFFLLWLKKQGVDDALIQPYSGHASRQSKESLKNREAKAITAGAKIERCSNQPIEVEEAIQRMKVFERLLSFATGAVHPFISCVGYCNDKAVYKSIRNISVDNWKTI